MPQPITPRVKVWIEMGGRYVFGYGITEVLQAVRRTGSIKEAARDLGKSYRYIWGRIKKAERALGQRLVATHVGGRGPRRSFLTPTAEQLVDRFSAVRERAIRVVEREFSRNFPRRLLFRGTP